MTATHNAIVGTIRKALDDYKAALEAATPDALACLGDYVIRTTPGMYFRVGSTQAVSITRCSRYLHRLGAGLEARNVRDGAGNRGEVVEYRKALIEEIERTAAILAEVEEAA